MRLKKGMALSLSPNTCPTALGSTALIIPVPTFRSLGRHLHCGGMDWCVVPHHRQLHMGLGMPLRLCNTLWLWGSDATWLIISLGNQSTAITNTLQQQAVFSGEVKGASIGLCPGGLCQTGESSQGISYCPPSLGLPIYRASGIAQMQRGGMQPQSSRCVL